MLFFCLKLYNIIEGRTNKIKKGNILLVLFKKVYNIYCKINRFFLRKRKIDKWFKKSHVHLTHESPSDIKTVAVKDITDKDVNELGRARGFQRKTDRTGNAINAVRNTKTGVVVMVTGSAQEIKAKFNEDYEVVESTQDGVPEEDLDEKWKQSYENRKTANEQ